MSNSDHAPAGAAGAIVRPEINGGTKMIRVADNARWNDEAEERFLEVLAASCNVRAAAEAAGFSTTAVYKRRMKWPGFAAAWAEAIEQGYARLEALVLEQASNTVSAVEISGDAPSPEVSFAERLNLLKLHRASVRGGAPQNYASRGKASDMDEIRASILRKIEAIERAEARKAEAGAPG